MWAIITLTVRSGVQPGIQVLQGLNKTIYIYIYISIYIYIYIYIPYVSIIEKISILQYIEAP